ncbi:MAG: ABC transporter permease, partial [Cyclobacteriaceae bacterium]|nr:ABC transporter permease [Cyclobacteriaceae bacterium]
MLLCIGLLPYFNMLTDLHLNAKTLLSGTTTAFILILSLSIGIVSGIYPAFYLSSLESLKILKGKFANSARSEALRKLLVTSQYFIAAMLITSILFVAQQTQYIKNKDIGFDKSNIITVAVPADTIVSRHINAYVEELKKQSYIKGATASFYTLDEEANQFTPTMENEDGSTFQMGADLIAIDADFMNAIGIEIVAGRNFSNTSKADQSGAILINETAVKKFNWGKNPLAGKYVAGPDREGKILKFQVVGVVKDFSLGASYKEINPLIIFLNSQGGRTLYARVDSNNLRASIEGMESIWKKQFAGFEFEYNFLDESLGKLYRKEEKFLFLLTAFSFIIVFIASLGIIGLISYTTELKKKEIAIRKVLGSPTDSIIVLLSKKFVALLLIANLAAIPASYYLISMWLESFSSRITISVWPFLISFAICALFTLISLLYHTIEATSANPVDSLNYD